MPRDPVEADRPPSGDIQKLTQVKELDFYGSNLIAIPPEIGRMSSLEVLAPYSSRRLHWFPYEITRCAGLRDSKVSTQTLTETSATGCPFHTSPPPFRAGRRLTGAVSASNLWRPRTPFRYGSHSGWPPMSSLFWFTPVRGIAHRPCQSHGGATCSNHAKAAPTSFSRSPVTRTLFSSPQSVLTRSKVAQAQWHC
jgi:hypothetical protein